MLRIALFLLLIAGAASAQARRPSHCIALAQSAPGLEYLHLAKFGDPLPGETLRLTYIDHSTFILETAGGLRVATDFTGYLGGLSLVPDVVTMNHAHDSHWTSRPDPAIPHALRGWGDGVTPADHHLDLGEMLVRNVPTDIRSRGGGGVQRGGNSIFVFEVAGLCVGHLGHLHHEPTPEQYASIGRLDVVMAAVDGGLTLDLPTMSRVLKRLRSSVVIPMHWFSETSLSRFLAAMEGEFAVAFPKGGHLEVSLRDLPRRPTIMVLTPAYLRPRYLDE